MPYVIDDIMEIKLETEYLTPVHAHGLTIGYIDEVC